MINNKQIRAAARESLYGRWCYPVLCTLIYIAVTLVCNTFLFNLPLIIISFAATLLCCVPLSYGYALTMQDVLHGESGDDIVTRPFRIFKEYFRYLGGSLLVTLFTFLWSLLLIVPGVIKLLSYAMTTYIMRDNPGLPVFQCIRRSQQMMKGHKAQFFGLCMSFIGWFFLGVISLRIGFLWIKPYFHCAVAKFYDELNPTPAK